jgi:hypothetical protein
MTWEILDRAMRSLGSRTAGRLDRLAVEAAERPLRVLAGLLALNLVAAACFVLVGLAIGDQAELFRELQVGTFLSFAELVFIAAIAYALHKRDEGDARWYASFWGLCAVAFAVFAFDEITQSLIFLSHLLEDAFGLGPAAGFHDLEAVLLTLLFGTVALIVAPRLGTLFRHPTALLVLGVAVALGVASQTLDSVAPATRWEFVAEETFKLSAEAFFAGGFLLALHNVLAPAPAAEAARALGRLQQDPRRA